jgi:hypothetical protein
LWDRGLESRTFRGSFAALEVSVPGDEDTLIHDRDAVPASEPKAGPGKVVADAHAGEATDVMPVLPDLPLRSWSPHRLGATVALGHFVALALPAAFIYAEGYREGLTVAMVWGMAWLFFAIPAGLLWGLLLFRYETVGTARYGLRRWLWFPIGIGWISVGHWALMLVFPFWAVFAGWDRHDFDDTFAGALLSTGSWAMFATSAAAVWGLDWLRRSLDLTKAQGAQRSTFDFRPGSSLIGVAAFAWSFAMPLGFGFIALLDDRILDPLPALAVYAVVSMVVAGIPALRAGRLKKAVLAERPSWSPIPPAVEASLTTTEWISAALLADLAGPLRRRVVCDALISVSSRGAGRAAARGSTRAPRRGECR